MTETAPKTNKTKVSSNIILWLLTWIAIIAIASFTIWQKDRTDDTESAHMIALVEKLDVLSAKVDAYDAQFMQIQEHGNSVVAAIQALDQQINQDNRAWRLLQVQSYIEQALLQASLMKDPNMAIQFLSAAEYQLQQLNDPKLATLNEAINNDKNALLEALPIDKGELIAAINVVIQEVPRLPQKTLEINSTSTDENTNDNKFNWKNEIKVTWNELKGLIQIRRHGEPITPYISDDQRYLINENLQLILQQANFSILQNKQALYTQQINTAIQWLQSYYDITNVNVQDVVAFLQKINTQPVEPIMTPTFQSLDVWNQANQVNPSNQDDAQ